MSHSKALRIIRTFASIPNGSGSAATAACNSRRIRRRSTRTFFRSTSRRAIGRRSGTSCATSSSSGCKEGVRVFRVDNPHTKPFDFWQWLIGDVRGRHPDVLFLAEAFARPRVMYRLAKLGFSQSYTYFTWRNTKHELTEHFTDLARRRDYFRPNLWPNTPDILHEYLQYGGRPAFMCRAVLAATLGASYGIYGPAFELLESEPREPGSEEYRDSEKYQVRRWDLRRHDSLKDFIARSEHDPPREPGAAVGRDATVSRDRQRAAHRLLEAHGGSRRRHPRRSEPRSASRAERLPRSAARGMAHGRLPELPGARSA